MRVTFQSRLPPKHRGNWHHWSLKFLQAPFGEENYRLLFQFYHEN